MEETDLNGPHRVKANLKAERGGGGDSVPSTDDQDALSGRVLCDRKKQEPAVSLVEDYHNRDLELFTNGLGDDRFWFCGKKLNLRISFKYFSKENGDFVSYLSG